MSVEGIEVARWGQGTPVLLVHGGVQGGPATGEDHWQGQRPLAEAGFELIVPSRPGHGESPSRGPEDIEADAVWIDEMLGRGAHLVGHSHGAAVALCAAGRRPAAVWSLTLIEAPIFSAARHRPKAVELEHQLDAPREIENPIAAIVAFAHAVNGPGAVGPPPTRAQLVAMGSGLKSMRGPSSWDASDAIVAVREAAIPTVIVDGGWSAGVAAISEELTEQLRGERFTIAAGHHFPHLGDTAEAFNLLLHQRLRDGRAD